KRTVVWTHGLPGSQRDRLDYAKLVEAVETITREDLPQQLTAAGEGGSPVPVQEEGKVPAPREGRLAGLHLTEQCAALPLVHESIRSDGESPERLGALVRGYANLGVLTEHHWNPAHKAFKARALFEAQRLVARQPGSAVSHWHRAYARALCG